MPSWPTAILDRLLHHGHATSIGGDSFPDCLEGTPRNGKTYTYFGVLSALLRLPFLPSDALAWLDSSAAYRAVGPGP